jgi:cytochrome c oxidase subunit II
MEVVPVFSPSSPQAKVIMDFFVAVLFLCAVIFLIVTGLITYSLVRFRGRPDAPEPRQTVGNKAIEVTWTLIPILIVTGLFVMTVRAMSRSDPVSKPQNADLVVTGHQWWWEVRYPKAGAITANEIHIPVGQRLLLRLESADVIHDFWAPQLSRKMDAVPGTANYIWLEADRPGTYAGVCAEYCGAEHAWMWFSVVAQPPAEFAAWQQRQLQPPALPNAQAAARGAQTFAQATCVNCHAIGGNAARLQVGPDLTHLAERHTLAAGVMPNTRTNLAQWLRNPQAFKPGTLMPNLQLTPTQVADLVDYLEPQEPGAAGRKEP